MVNSAAPFDAPEKSAKSSVKDTIKQTSSKRYSESNKAYPVHIIKHILGGLSASQKLRASNHSHAFFYKIHINLKHKVARSRVIRLEAIHQDKKK